MTESVAAREKIDTGKEDEEEDDDGLLLLDLLDEVFRLDKVSPRRLSATKTRRVNLGWIFKLAVLNKVKKHIVLT